MKTKFKSYYNITKTEKDAYGTTIIHFNKALK